MRRLAIIAIASLCMLLAGCVFNISLAPESKPYKETVIEGTATAKIVVVEVSGMISDEQDEGALGKKKPSMPDAFAEALAKAAKDDDVKGLIVRINTPGGAVSTSDTMYNELRRYKIKTGNPVYASIVGMGTSGGYYIASAADAIYAQPTSLTGSIGVIALSLDFEGLMDKLGVRDKTHKSGQNKAVFTPFRPDTPEESSIINGIIETLHARFVDVVAEGRHGKLTRERVGELADGRPYTADQALALGLIEGIAYPSDVVSKMRGEIKQPKARVVMYRRPGTHKGSIYSLSNVSGNTIVNLDASGLAARTGVRFMYLWDGYIN